MKVKLSISNLSRYLLTLAVMIAILASQVTIAIATTSFGGYVSNALIARLGINNAKTLIGDNVPNSLLEIAMGPAVTTLAATNVGMVGPDTQATLRGTLVSLNGFNNATILFNYGYTTAYGLNTASSLAISTGNYTATIASFDTNTVIHFRIVAISGDATAYGSDSTFMVTTASPGRSNARWIPPIVAIVAILVPLILLASGLPAIVIVVITTIIGIVGIIAVALLQGLLQTMG